MLDKTKSLKHRFSPGKRYVRLASRDVAEARQYIDKYWEHLKRFHPKDDETLLGLPKAYLVPAYEEGHPFDFNEMYYWDSYFMVQGMLKAAANDDQKSLVVGILENFESLIRRFRIIPNASRTYLMGRSQPPFLTSLIFDIYEAYGMDKEWLKNKLTVARTEYETVWMGTSKPHWRQVYEGLSRYYDINMLHDLAEAESGWDMTPRFGRKALDYLPVDLNALLYKYESDFAQAAELIGDNTEAHHWHAQADSRRHTMNQLMWDDARGLYYDYNFVKGKRGTVASLATYYPLWAGLVDDKQAKKLVKNLRRFEEKGGLATTEASSRDQLNQLVAFPGQFPTQWAYPNGWAPLHYVVIKGLQRYGYDADAERIAHKWLKTNLDWFNEQGVFLEKYNVVQPTKPPMKGVYPSQTGFGWTNAVFERLCQDFID